MKLRISIALMMALIPTLALARTHGSSSHMRPQLVHDRTPKARFHSPKPHFNNQ